MKDLRCPALHYGHMAGCRSCIYIHGGPSDLCIKMRQAWDRKQRERAATASERTPEDAPGS